MALESTGTFSGMEIDSIGEILNISMGSAATTLSEILGKKVNITTPKVQILHSSKIQVENYEPAIGVEIRYDKGILGNNIMVMRVSDARKILNILLNFDPTEESDELDEMASGAMAEIMNQMMGASATSLSTLLERQISITPPTTFPVKGNDQLRKKYFMDEGDAVVTTFRLTVEDVIDSNFVVMMEVDLAHELVAAFSFVMQPEPEPIPEPAPTIDVSRAAPPPKRKREEPTYEVNPVQYPSFDVNPHQRGDKTDNLGLILSVPLEVRVEIGQTKKTIRDVLEFSPGTVLELNKQVGTQVDVYVNGKPIAKGDVVVVDDHYGVRITEVSSNREIMEKLS